MSFSLRPGQEEQLAAFGSDSTTTWTEADEERFFNILNSLEEYQEEDLPPHLMPLPPSPLPDIEDTNESINSTIKEIRDDIKTSSPTMIKNKILNVISHLKQFPPRPKVSEAIQEIREIIEDMAKSARLHPNPRLRKFTLKAPKQNLSHQLSKPGTRWASVSKGSTRRSRRYPKSRKSRRATRRATRKSRRATRKSRRATRRI
jgi:ribonuclease D